MSPRNHLPNKYLTIWIFVLFIDFPLKAQQDFDSIRSSVYSSINLNYILGAQLYNDNFLYNPGYSVDFTVGKNLENDLGIGLGFGFTDLKDKLFIPLYLEVLGKKKNKSNTPIIKFQGGYSLGWDQNTSNMVNYDLKGGFYFNAGIGREIEVQGKYSILFLFSFCHQFAKLEYQVFGEKEYSETLNYDMLKMSIGILFH